jgi:tRNA(Ile)-lysidine synthase
MKRGHDARGLTARFAAHVAEHGVFPSPGAVLVAVSGGADSLALLHLLADLGPGLGLEPVAGHVDHGIAPTSRRWARTVAAVAADLGLRMVEERLDLGPTSETVARRERYRALRRMQREVGARYLATAHHADDQVETVLFRVLRGSGPAGLAGIPARGPHGLVRPLLPFRRAELEAWLRRRAPGVEPVTDPANESVAHDRSWLRTAILPLLRQRFPDVDDRLLATGRQAALEREAWGALVALDPSLDAQRVDGGIEVARGPLGRYDKALSVALLRALAREAGLRLGLGRAERLAEFVATASSGRVLDLGERWTAETVFDRLRILGPPNRPSARPPNRGLVVVGEGERGEARWRGWCITWRRERAGTVARAERGTWVTPGGLSIRAALRGERVRPLGGVGRRPVRRLLMEARVPRPERATYPVVARGSDLVWIPGVCRGDAALPAPGEPAVRLDARRIRHP